MINLLADEYKDDIRAARVNVILVRYIAILLMAFVFLMAVLYVSYTVLQNTKKSAEAIISTNDIKADVYSETRGQVQALSSKLAETKATLDQDVSYAKVFTILGQLMPSGSVLDSLDLNETSFNGTPVPLKIYAKTNEDAVLVRQKLQTSKLFSQVNLQSTDATKGITDYPVALSLTVVFNKAGVK